MQLTSRSFRWSGIPVGIIFVFFHLFHFLPMTALAEESQRIFQVRTQGPKGPLLKTYPGGQRDGYLLTIRDGRVVETETLGSGMRDIIIQLNHDPLFTGNAQGKVPTSQPTLKRMLERVKAKIIRLESEYQITRKRATVKRHRIIRREYSRVFPGFAARVNEETIRAIQRLPEVKRVWPDGEVQALLADSMPLIRADRVHDDLGFTGHGVIVAIIDTGIDYTHPDLGGCLGPSCKVADGYDFVNDDLDPMDDNGHGTHLAGIVAANGGVTGVAPDATLMAHKVLNSAGFGSTSDVIAAMERAVDPDGDPTTADGARVINLSFGRTGDPDDPLSQAVDNAVAAGAVVVVAATGYGNYYEMLSPAIARQALAVGGTDKSDQLASFTSRGPSPETFQIKPEVLAPGVGITSTVPRGDCERCDPSGYRPLDGTSAAAAHVSGPAALLLEQYPHWQPEQVKAAITARAVNLGIDVFTQGGGRIDAYASSSSKGLASPGSLSLGLDDIRESTFHRIETLTLANLTVSQLNYDLSVMGDFPPGMTAVVSPDQLALNPGEAGTFTFELTVNNATVPNVSEPPYGYEGSILVQSDSEALRIPFAFIKSPVLEVSFDEEPSSFAVHNRLDFYRSFLSPRLSHTIPVAEGLYDVIVDYFDDRPPTIPASPIWVFREGVGVSTRTRLKIRKAEAAYTLVIIPIDQNGNPLELTRAFGFLHFYYKPSPLFYMIGIWSGPLTTFKFSSMSDSYRFEVMLMEDRNPIGAAGYTFYAHAKDGISGSMVFQNRPEDFKHVTLRYAVDPGVTEVFPRTDIGSLSSGAGTVCHDNDPPLTSPFEEEFYLLAPPHPDFRLGFVTKRIYRYTDSPCDMQASDLLFEATSLRPKDPQVIEGYLWGMRWDEKMSLFSTPKESLPLGVGPSWWFGRFENRPDEIQILPALGGRFKPFLGQLGDYRPQDPLPYELYQNGLLVKSGDLPGLWSSRSSIPVAPGPYTLRVTFSNLLVAGEMGQAIMNATFDTNGADPIPPYLTQFQLYAKGEISDTLPAPGGEVRFRIFDAESGIGPLSLSYDIGAGWQEMTIRELTPGEYAASLPAMCADVPFVDLRLLAEDTYGNLLSLEMTPAFKVEPGFILEPTGGTIGTEFTINGCHQWAQEGEVFIGERKCKILAWTDVAIECRVKKKKILPGTYDVTIQSPAEGAGSPILIENAFTIKSPEITSIKPTKGSAGDEIAVRGEFFGQDIYKVRGKVFLEYMEGGVKKRKSCPVFRWNMDPRSGKSKIKFVVRDGIAPGTYDLTVQNKIGRDTVVNGFTAK